MKQLQIIVCIKQIPDPEAPSEIFRIDSEKKEVTATGVPPVINPFDENALEAALRIKDRYDSKITVISMGENLAYPVLMKSLGVGADELILIKDHLFKELSSSSTAYVLSRVVSMIENYDLILAGRQAGDWDFGIVGLLIGEILQLPSINFARKIEIENNNVIVEKICRNGYEIVKAPMPTLITASSEVGELRFASIKGLHDARKKPVKTFNAKDLRLDSLKLKVRYINSLSATQNQRECMFIEGETPQEKGMNLAAELRRDKLI
jgi:electron transfer flavoprotein beta subunit